MEARFTDLADRTGWDSRTIAQLLRFSDDRLVRRWLSGHRLIPADALEWLERLAEHIDKNPPPKLSGRPRDTGSANELITAGSATRRFS